MLLRWLREPWFIKPQIYSPSACSLQGEAATVRCFARGSPRFMKDRGAQWLVQWCATCSRCCRVRRLAVTLQRDFPVERAKGCRYIPRAAGYFCQSGASDPGCLRETTECASRQLHDQCMMKHGKPFTIVLRECPLILFGVSVFAQARCRFCCFTGLLGAPAEA